MTAAVVACGALAVNVRRIARRRGWAIDVHPVPAGHLSGGGGTYHARSPVVSATACSPPGFGVRISETGK